MKTLFTTFIALIFFGSTVLAQWNPLNPPTTAQMGAVSFANANTGFIGGTGGELYKTTDGGATWATQTSGIAQHIFSIEYVNPTTAYACASTGTGVIIKTTDGGATWTSQTFPSTSYLLDMHFPSDSVGYCVGYNGVLMKTTDWGVNWTFLSSGTSNDLRSVFFTDENTGYVAQSSGIVSKTTDGGATWTAYSTPTTSLLLGIHFADASTGYAVGVGGQIVKTTNAGLNWTLQSSNTSETLQAVHFVSANQGYAVGGSGVIASTTDGGATWSPQNFGTFSGVYGWYDVTFINGEGYVSGYAGEVSKKACPASTGTDTQVACDSYTWIDGNTYTASNNTATYTLANSAGCDSIVTLNLTINSLDVSVVNNDPMIVANASGVSYQWMDCADNSLISGETNQSFSASANGEYAVIISDGTCSDTSECVSITTVGVASISIDENLTVYPNPSENGVFTVDFSEVLSKIDRVYVINSLGQVVLNDFQLVENELTIEVIEAGVYMLIVEMSGGEQRTIRLVSM